jgi:hypothetical protein
VGFSSFPKSERPFTFRSGSNFSTIDYALVRGAQVSQFQVARYVDGTPLVCLAVMNCESAKS